MTLATAIVIVALMHGFGVSVNYYNMPGECIDAGYYSEARSE